MKNILVFGSGSIANQHIKNLIKLKLNVFVFIKNSSEKKRFNILIINKIKFIYKFSELKKHNITFAIVASSTHQHTNDIEFLINNKVHIFCEKPISNNLIELNRLRKKILDKKIFFYVNYQLKKHWLIHKLIQLIKNKKINYVNIKVGHNLKYWRKKKIRKNSYFIDTKKGGGVIYELIHEINLINYIFGKITKIKTIKKNILGKFTKCEDQAISLFQTKKNLSGTLVQDMVSENKERYLEVFLNNSTIKLDIVKNKIYIFNNKKKIYY